MLQKIPFSCYLDQKTIRELKAKAKAEDTTIASLIRRAINAFLGAK